MVAAQEQVETTLKVTACTPSGVPHGHCVSLLVVEPLKRSTGSDTSSETPFLGVSMGALDCLRYERLWHT